MMWGWSVLGWCCSTSPTANNNWGRFSVFSSSVHHGNEGSRIISTILSLVLFFLKLQLWFVLCSLYSWIAPNILLAAKFIIVITDKQVWGTKSYVNNESRASVRKMNGMCWLNSTVHTKDLRPGQECNGQVFKIWIPFPSFDGSHQNASNSYFIAKICRMVQKWQIFRHPF